MGSGHTGPADNPPAIRCWCSFPCVRTRCGVYGRTVAEFVLGDQRMPIGSAATPEAAVLARTTCSRWHLCECWWTEVCGASHVRDGAGGWEGPCMGEVVPVHVVAQEEALVVCFQCCCLRRVSVWVISCGLWFRRPGVVFCKIGTGGLSS